MDPLERSRLLNLNSSVTHQLCHVIPCAYANNGPSRRIATLPLFTFVNKVRHIPTRVRAFKGSIHASEPTGACPNREHREEIPVSQTTSSRARAKQELTARRSPQLWHIWLSKTTWIGAKSHECTTSRPRTKTWNGNHAFNAEHISHQQNLAVRGLQGCEGLPRKRAVGAVRCHFGTGGSGSARVPPAASGLTGMILAQWSRLENTRKARETRALRLKQTAGETPALRPKQQGGSML